MFKEILIIASLLISASQAAISEPDKAVIFSRNILVNPGFESGKAGWTASGGTFSTTTSSAAVGTTMGTWDSNGASQTLTSTLTAIPPGWYGQNGVLSCRIKCASGSCTHTIGAWDGTTLTSSQTITSTTSGYARTTSNFIFPSSGSIGIRLTSVASDEPSISIDSCMVAAGDQFNLSQVSQARLLGTIKYAGATNCAWVGSASATFANFSADTDCSSPSVTGSVTAPGTKIPGGVFSSLPPGDLYIVATGAFGKDSTTGTEVDFRFSDGTNTSAKSVLQTTTVTNRTPIITGRISYTTAQSNLTIQIQGASDATATPRIENGDSNKDLEISFYYFPSSSEQAYRADGMPAFAYATHGNDCSWSSTSTSFADPTDDATCTFTASSTNAKNLTLSSVGSVSPQITWTPDRARDYDVCAMVALSNGTTANSTGFSLTDGSNNALPGGYATSVDSSGNTMEPKFACGKITAPSTSAVVVKARIAVNGGTGKFAAAGTGGLVSVSIPTIQWSVKALDTLYGVPLLVGSVTSNSTGAERLERASVANSGTASISSQSGSWISSVSRTAAGVVSHTLTASIFSSTPSCVCSVKTASHNRICQIESASTSTIVTSTQVASSNTDTDAPVELICMGPR